MSTWLYCPRCQGLLTIGPTPAAGLVECPQCREMVQPEKEPSLSRMPETLATPGNRFKAKGVKDTPAEAEPPPTPPREFTDPAGSSVAGYQILGVLGRGGMGVVYKARHVELKRLVALKMILSGEHAGPDELARFKAEAEAVARLQHPNIVQIYEVGEHNGLPFFCLEFVDGGTLDSKLDSKPLPGREAAQLLEPIARAIHAAHMKGIIHRDLKPGNVLLQIADCGLRIENPEEKTQSATRNPQSAIPKITDFGLAKRLDVELGQTASGMVLGTPSYMAPEQAMGKVKDIGPAADIYALGAMLYEMLTGRPPFSGETAVDIVLQVAMNDPVPPSRLNPKAPRELETICLKCLEKDPFRRYASAEEMADDLRRYLGDEPITARPATARERLMKWARRRPAVAALSALSLLIFLVGFTGILWNWAVAVSERNQKERAQLEAEKRADAEEKAKIKAQDAELEAKRQEKLVEAALSANRIQLASLEWWNNNVGRSRQLLELCPESHRHWEWHYVDRLCHADRLTLEGHATFVVGAVWSPDGKRIATASFDKTVKIWDAATGKVLRTIDGHKGKIYGAVYTVAFSPDGHLLSAADDRTIRRWDAASGKAIWTTADIGAWANHLAVSPDGQSFATAEQNGQVRLWGTANGKEIARLGKLAGDATCVAFSPDGGQLAAAGGGRSAVHVWDLTRRVEIRSFEGTQCVAFSPIEPIVAAGLRGDVVLRDVKTGDVLRTLERADRRAVYAIAFSPDGLRLAGAGDEGMIRLWHVPTGRLINELRGHTGLVRQLAFDPKGEYLLSASRDRTAKVWVHNQIQAARTLRGHRGIVQCLALDRSGEFLASAGQDGTIQLWNGKLGIKLGAVPSHQAYVSALAISPDGLRIASESRDGVARVWDLARRKEALSLKVLNREHGTLTFSPDGRQLARADGHQIQLLDAQTGKLLRTLAGHRGPISGQPAPVASLAYRPDGKQLASSSSASDGRIKLWDPATGAETGILQPLSIQEIAAPVHCVVYSPDGRRLGSGDAYGIARIWDLAGGKEIQSFAGQGVVRSVAFSPDGRRFATVSSELVKIWDPDTGRELITLRGHSAPVHALLWLDNARLASAAADELIKIWDGTPRKPK